jgi:hypothetical protein
VITLFSRWVLTLLRLLAIGLFFAQLLLGCTALDTVDAPVAEAASRWEVGTHIVVYERDGRRIDMRYVRADDRYLYGSLMENGMEPVKVAFADVERIEAEEVSLILTSLGALGLLVVLPIMALGMGAELAAEMNQ